VNTIEELVVLLHRRDERIEELHTQLDAWEDVRRAVLDKEQTPGFHNLVMGQHRQEWPTLWAAIDNALETQP
jgi:hypothetical protein